MDAFTKYLNLDVLPEEIKSNPKEEGVLANPSLVLSSNYVITALPWY